MDNTLEALAEIEKRAERILEHAICEQQNLSKKHSDDIKSLEKEIMVNTDNTIKELKNNLNKELENKLNCTKKDNEETLKKIETIYNSKHKEIVNRLFKQITAM